MAVAYLLWALGLLALPFGLPLGLSGVHRFYCGKSVSGALWLLTAGLCGVGQLVDLFLIPELVRQANQPLVLEEALAQAPWAEPASSPSRQPTATHCSPCRIPSAPP